MLHRLGMMVGAFAALSVPAIAAAATLPPVTGSITIGPDESYDHVVVESTGTITVRQYDARKQPTGGRLRIRANSITIKEGGRITVSGAGLPGREGQSGLGPGAGLLGRPEQAGGGAGAVGIGGQGTDMGCNLLGGLGGPAYMIPEPPNLMTTPFGSSGGAANASGFTSGGRGGGLLILEANEIVLDGTLEANGGDGFADSGAGGGSGGIIHLRAYQFTSGAAALISARGGNGSTKELVRNGGGGAGGLILFEAPNDVPFSSYDVAGGTSGDCIDTGKGADGLFELRSPPAECLDLDEDGVSACDGDCNDVDGSINPGAADECDGIDNDCNDVIEDVCDPGQVCGVAAAGGLTCLPGEDGDDDDGPETPTDQVVYIGGCSLAQQADAALSAMVAAALLALASRRRRR